MINSKPSHHQNPNGTFGTQSFCIPDQPHTWKLDITSCLITLPHRAPTHEEVSTMDPIEITTLDHWNPLDHNSSHMENIRPLLQFSPNAYDDLYACNAVMLADDKTRSIFFDSIQGDKNLHSLPEDFKPCFDGIKLPDTIKDTSYDPFLSSMSHVKLHKSQNAFDTASYFRLA